MADQGLTDQVGSGQDLQDTQNQLQQQQQIPIKRDRGLDDEEEDDDDRKSGRERRKIEIKFIPDKSRRHITFSKRKAGIMKKAYELSVLTGTQVLLLVVSETGLVYTFTTPKLQPLVTKPEGKNLIQACLNAPEEPATGPAAVGAGPGPSPGVGAQVPPQLSNGQHDNDPNAGLLGMPPGMSDDPHHHQHPQQQHMVPPPQQLMGGMPPGARGGMPGQVPIQPGMPPNVYMPGPPPDQASPYPYGLPMPPQQQQQQQQQQRYMNNNMPPSQHPT